MADGVSASEVLQMTTGLGGPTRIVGGTDVQTRIGFAIFQTLVNYLRSKGFVADDADKMRMLQIYVAALEAQGLPELAHSITIADSRTL